MYLFIPFAGAPSEPYANPAGLASGSTASVVVLELELEEVVAADAGADACTLARRKIDGAEIAMIRRNKAIKCLLG
jgi:hypothetical protein